MDLYSNGKSYGEMGISLANLSSSLSLSLAISYIRFSRNVDANIVIVYVAVGYSMCTHHNGCICIQETR